MFSVKWKPLRSFKKALSRKINAVPLLCLFLTVVLNLLSRISTGFADRYASLIFPLWMSVLGRVSSLCPFSVGEWLLVAACILVLLFLLGLFLLPFRAKYEKADRFIKVYYPAFFRIACVVSLVMTLGCFIQYQATPLEYSLPGYGREYSLEDLAKLRDTVVLHCEELSLKVPRDAEGEVVYEGDMREAARSAVRGLSGSWPRLSGYQPLPKPLFFSGFVSQQYMQGYYFPFSMEANYNTVMKIMNRPFTMCHELSHTHGYILEDEANFLAFLACTQSEDPVFAYSGWLGVLNYVNNDFYYAVSREEYDRHPAISRRVYEDNLFLTDADWKKVEENALLETETVRKAADTYVDTTLKANGIGSGKLSYSHVVALLLEYGVE